jgi:hypothetical protein
VPRAWVGPLVPYLELCVGCCERLGVGQLAYRRFAAANAGSSGRLIDWQPVAPRFMLFGTGGLNPFCHHHLALVKRRRNISLISPPSLLTSSTVASKPTYSYHHASTGLKPARPLRSTLKPSTSSTAGSKHTCRRKRKTCIALRNLEVARYPRS